MEKHIYFDLRGEMVESLNTQEITNIKNQLMGVSNTDLAQKYFRFLDEIQKRPSNNSITVLIDGKERKITA